MLFDSPQETLYTVLIISIVILTIFLAVALLYLILVLRDSSKILDKVRDTTEKVNDFVVKPVKLATTLIDHLKPILESALEARLGGKKKKK